MKTYYIKTKYKPGYEATIVSEVTEQEIRNLIKENPELIDFWGDEIRNNFFKQPTHKRKYFVPKVGEQIFYIDTNNTISYTFEDIRLAKHLIKSGNCFATEQDATDELNKRQALVRIWNNYDDKYSWDIDWSNRNELKYDISYDNTNKSFIDNLFGTSYMIRHTELPYFKSAEDRNQFVKDNESDLKLIFNIK